MPIVTAFNQFLFSPITGSDDVNRIRIDLSITEKRLISSRLSVGVRSADAN